MRAENQQGLQVTASAEQNRVDSVIDHILAGKLYAEDSRCLSDIIEKLSQTEQIDGVVLGCTDLPVLHHHYPISTKLPLYDSIKIPAEVVRELL